MVFITVKDLNKDIVDNFDRIPVDIDVIVGIPRSGMLVASLIALYMNKPLIEIDSFVNEINISVGHTKSIDNLVLDYPIIQKVLVVDDSVYSGKSLMEAKEKMRDVKYAVFYFAPYIRSDKIVLVDSYFRVIDDIRLFEWNYMHHTSLIKCCMDIDGVLCYDPTILENDDGENYRHFISSARPKFIPSRTVGYLVTSRLEKYRSLTEDWLKDSGVSYNQLIMLQMDSAEERRKSGCHAGFKAEIYKKKSDTILFIESNEQQAREIAKLSGKPVFCVESQTYYDGSKLYYIRMNIKNSLKRYLPHGVIVNLKKIKKKFDSI